MENEVNLKSPEILFLIVPNNSGSTILHNALSLASDIAVLPDEGQFCWGDNGPNPIKLNAKHIFALKESLFINPNNYKWENIKLHWAHHWGSNNPDAKVRMEKSPPNVLRVSMLKNVCSFAKFVFMTRNPYAMVEGILRGNTDATLTDAAVHTIRMLDVQMKNIISNPDSPSFSYEEFTSTPQHYINLVCNHLNITAPDVTTTIPAKAYNESIKNMNDRQIENLSGYQIDILNKFFNQKPSVMEFFGYHSI